MTNLLTSVPPLRLAQDGPSLTEQMTALPVATLLVRPDNGISEANVRAETLLNMARSAIIGSDVARTIRIAEAGARFDIWHSNKPIAAYDIKVHAGRTAEMDVDLMISPIVDHDGSCRFTRKARPARLAIADRRAVRAPPWVRRRSWRMRSRTRCRAYVAPRNFWNPAMADATPR
jgi:hypothetical protein